MHKERLPNFLVTGGTGFVGRRFVNLLVSKNCKFKLVIRNSANSNKADIFTIDRLNSKTCWDGAFENIDCVVHLAGLAHNVKLDELYYREVNVLGTLKLATEAARSGVRRFVFVSSIGVNGAFTNGKPFNELMDVDPQNSYTNSKHAAEQGLLRISQETEMEVVIIRPTLIYGQQAPGNFGLLTKLVSKVSFMPFGLLNNKRSYISLDNISDFLLECAINPSAANETFVIAEGEPVSTKEFTNEMAKGMRKSLIQVPVPLSLLHMLAKFIGKTKQMNQLLGDLEVDSSKARNLLGWKAPETMKQAMAKLRQ